MFIPLLLLGGIIGRLFREFAVTTTMCIAVSAFVALTLTPMMASRFLRSETRAQHGRFYAFTERGFDRLLPPTSAGSTSSCATSSLTLCVFLATLVATVYLFVVIPKGFFPQQDTGMITGISEAAQDVSFAEMMRRQEALGAIIGKDPAVATYAMAIGAGGSTSTLNNGRFFITLKPKGERDVSAGQVIARLRPQLEKVEGARLFLQAAQDVNVGGRAARTQFQYTLQDANIDELNEWAPKVLEQAQVAAAAARRRFGPADVRARRSRSTIDRDQASRYGLTPQLIDDTLYDAFGQRQVAQYFTQQNSYHVVMEILPELQGDVATPGQDLHQVADHRAAGAARHLRQMDHARDQAPFDQPPGPVPRRHHQLQPGAGRVAGHRDGGDPARRARDAGAAVADRHASRATRRPSRPRCARCRC